MAHDTSERSATFPLASGGGFSLFIYGVALLVVVLSIYGMINPSRMSFFCWGRGIFVLPFFLGILILVSEASRQNGIRKLKARIRRIERERRGA